MSNIIDLNDRDHLVMVIDLLAAKEDDYTIQDQYLIIDCFKACIKRLEAELPKKRKKPRNR